MPCTTILAGKNATFDGSTFLARNEDSPSGEFTPKKFIVVKPEDQPREYQSVISKVKITLPDDPMRYTAVPNALPNEGIWGEAGVNACNVAMSETETITSNPRVLGADPLVKEGIGEEDFLTIVLPYIHSAREGVKRLGELLETYGTYEMNGVGFQDKDEVWWLESIGGHHWIAKRVPDDCYVVMPNQQGIDWFDLEDAYGEQKDHMCSKDLKEFMEKYHLDLTMPYEDDEDTLLDARAAFGSHDDSDHSYNTPRAWYMIKHLNPNSFLYEGPMAELKPEADDLPWAVVPEHKLTVEDVKYVLSSHYQGTKYDPYGKYGDPSERGKYRPIGINRNNFLSLTMIRPDVPEEYAALQWIAMGSNPFNAFVPFYANVESTPEYFSNTGKTVTTDSFYWSNRLIGALADAHMSMCSSHIERYQNRVHSLAWSLIHEGDDKADGVNDIHAYLEECNQKMSDMVRKETESVLDKVLYEASNEMKNGFSRSDA